MKSKDLQFEYLYKHHSGQFTSGRDISGHYTNVINIIRIYRVGTIQMCANICANSSSRYRYNVADAGGLTGKSWLLKKWAGYILWGPWTPEHISVGIHQKLVGIFQSRPPNIQSYSVNYSNTHFKWMSFCIMWPSYWSRNFYFWFTWHVPDVDIIKKYFWNLLFS